MGTKRNQEHNVRFKKRQPAVVYHYADFLSFFETDIRFKFIKEIGRKIKRKNRNTNATSHIIQAISMTVQRGNATRIMDLQENLKTFLT